MKTCSKCKVEKPLSEFGKDKRHTDGLRSDCKVCRRVVVRANYEANREARKEKSRANYAAHRDDRLAYARAYRESNAEAVVASAARYREENRELLSDRSSAWYHSGNKDLVIARNKKWREAHPQRAKELARKTWSKRRASRKSSSFVVTDRDMRRLVESPCAVPGCTSEDVTIDHVIPLSRGGVHSIGNLQPLCLSHNASKNNKTWMEFRVYLMRRQAA